MEVNLNTEIQNLQECVDSYNKKQTKAGATLLRKMLMNMSKSCTAVRKTVLDNSKAVPKKTREKKGTDSEKEELSESSDM